MAVDKEKFRRAAVEAGREIGEMLAEGIREALDRHTQPKSRPEFMCPACEGSGEVDPEDNRTRLIAEALRGDVMPSTWAARLVMQLVADQQKYADADDEYGEAISDPNGYVTTVRVGSRRFEVRIEEE